MAIVIHSEKIVFIHIPKTGGTSIRKVLTDHYGSDVEVVGHEHGSYSDLLKIGIEHGINYDGYKSISVVRNPYEWLVSMYNYISDPNVGHSDMEVVSKLTFDQFVRWMFLKTLDPIEEGKPFYRPQRYFICDGGYIQVDYVLSLWEVKNSHPMLLNLFPSLADKGLKIPHLMKSDKRKKLDINKQTVELINQLFYSDFVIFNYKFK